MDATEGLETFALNTEHAEDLQRAEWSKDDGALYLVFQERQESNEGSVLKIVGDPAEIRAVCQAILDAAPVSAVVADVDVLLEMRLEAKVEALSVAAELIQHSEPKEFNTRNKTVRWLQSHAEMVDRARADVGSHDQTEIEGEA